MGGSQVWPQVWMPPHWVGAPQVTGASQVGEPQVGWQGGGQVWMPPHWVGPPQVGAPQVWMPPQCVGPPAVTGWGGQRPCVSGPSRYLVASPGAPAAPCAGFCSASFDAEACGFPARERFVRADPAAFDFGVFSPPDGFCGASAMESLLWMDH